ncbi:T9SS type A sorting domain-containing protein [Flavobacterium sp.]|uniref:T9SS type A sorting domain-containing protein n=1 Tax=Flavobacterium sp. TaxID=239 RepID=UPI0039E57B6E
MKKTPLLFLCMLAASLIAQAQTIHQTVFPSGGAPAGWTTEILHGETNWYFGDIVLPGSTIFTAPAAIFNDDIAESEDYNEARLLSPVFNTNGYNTVSLSFEYGLKQINDLGTLTVEVFDGTAWQQILLVSQTVEPVLSPVFDLTPYKNQQFQLRYTFHDGGIQGMGAGITHFKLEGTYTTAPNDIIENATTLSCGYAAAGSTALSTAETGLPVCNGVDGNTKGVWYQYSDILNQTHVTLSLCDSQSGLDTRLNVYRYIDAFNLECVASNDDSCDGYSNLTFHNDGVSTYYILVSGAADTEGDFQLSVACQPVVPVNDDIVNAIDIDPTPLTYTDFAVPLTKATMEAETGDFEQTGCNTLDQINVFYKFTAIADGTAKVHFTTTIPNMFSQITFYTAPNENAAIANLQWVNQPTNTCHVLVDQRTIDITAGTTYYAVVMNGERNSDVVFTFTQTLGIDTPEFATLNIYPNPTNAKVNINAPVTIDRLSLYNVLGQHLQTQTPSATDTEVDLSALPSGTYLLKAVSGDRTLMRKIIKK